VGDEIMFESIEIIQGGLIQIDIKNVTKTQLNDVLCNLQNFSNYLGMLCKEAMINGYSGYRIWKQYKKEI
jgi:hypothetical protein